MAVTTIISGLVIAVFAALPLVHLYWLFGGQVGQLVAIPEIDGKPIFEPSAVATLVVAIGLALCAVVIAGTAGMLAVPLSQPALAWLTRALAVVLLARAIGDFRLVGFCKRIRNSRFARLDTVVYSPLCLALNRFSHRRFRRTCLTWRSRGTLHKRASSARSAPLTFNASCSKEIQHGNAPSPSMDQRARLERV